MATDDPGILPAENWTVQGTSAGYGASDGESSTASLTESIYAYRTLHGRTYHADRGESQYWGTNDNRQNESLDINHHACTLALDGKLFLAPLEKDKVKNALDLGTGTGIWAIDFAVEFPDATVLGTDLSPIQPSFIPPNLKFEIDDYNQEWTFPQNHFDYVHTRWLLGTPTDWNVFLKRAFDSIKPGGWLETYEMSAIIESDDDTVTDQTALGQWGKIFIDGGKKAGRSFTIVQDNTQRKAMEAAGFVDIQEHNIKMPIGGWAADPKLKEVGLYSQLVLEGDPEGYVLFMTSTLGWSREQILAYIAAVKRETRSGKLRPYYKQKVVWGRKP
ncbi:S-adenosyl-L-methionine-dependent methyltransferase [Immersiella caudata]|uniref:S-adenosyl-L-methionine-dependent methyltransferase n=1 Tax=Immersiella caudata TaxID=314043 RepID=A0AA39T1T5_9PEZI|nr:S-adenosyl-L-methionine-dependent methyltransferase [Immersiella caudata]